MREQASTTDAKFLANGNLDKSPLNDSLTDLGWLLTSLECITDVCVPTIPSERQDIKGPMPKTEVQPAPKTKKRKVTADWEHDATVKPPFSIDALIYTAIKTSTKSKASLADIYAFITRHFIYYRLAGETWKSTVRTALKNGCFRKVAHGRDESGKRCCWAIDPSKESTLLKQTLPVFKANRGKTMKSVSSKKKANKAPMKQKSPLFVRVKEEHTSPDWESLLASSLNSTKAMDDGTGALSPPPGRLVGSEGLLGMEHSARLRAGMPHPWACESVSGYLNKLEPSSGCGSLLSSFNDVFPNFSSNGAGAMDLSTNGLIVTGHSIFSLSTGPAAMMGLLEEAPVSTSVEDDYDSLFEQPYPSDWVPSRAGSGLGLPIRSV